MNIFIESIVNILFQIFGIALLAVVTFSIAKTLYKPSYTKNITNRICYILLGIIICLAVSYILGSNDTPQCLEMEYDVQGSYCVEFDDSVAPKNYIDKIQSSGKFFGITLLSFLFFVYRTKSENKIIAQNTESKRLDDLEDYVDQELSKRHHDKK